MHIQQCIRLSFFFVCSAPECGVRQPVRCYWHRPLSEQMARPRWQRAAGSRLVARRVAARWMAARSVAGSAVAGSAVGTRWWCSAARRHGSAVGGGAADSSAVGCPRRCHRCCCRCHRCCCRCRARPCRAACPKRTVAPRRGTQWIPHSHVQSTQPCGATLTHTRSASAAAAFTTVDVKPIAK